MFFTFLFVCIAFATKIATKVSRGFHRRVFSVSSASEFRTDSMRDCCVRRSAAKTDRMGQRGLRKEFLCAKPVRFDLVGLLVSFRAAGTACAIMST
eukprot:COSAG03_NODE_1280_length_4412_cov_1.761651_4_plen_96_part_00